jgi:uncharacterized membrane protein YfcA
MDVDVSTLAFAGLTFVIAGFVKGVIGLGLPTISIGLLSLVLLPPEAAALVIVPTIVTNIWQAAVGPQLAALLRRLWPMFVALCLGTFAGAGFLNGGNTAVVRAALGAVLALYAILGLTAVRFSVPARAEIWLTPLIGLATGIVTAATGVSGILPSVPYLQALGIDKHKLVQAMGLSFTISAIALGAAGARRRAAGQHRRRLAARAAVAGMGLGQMVRTRIRDDAFRTWFFVGMLLLGCYFVLRTIV